MQEAIDFSALNWVRRELGDTLERANRQLRTYAADRENTKALMACAGHLHEARGPLRMVDLKGADMLAAEVEEVIADLQAGAFENTDAVVDVLVQAFQQLRDYLSGLHSESRDIPAVLLPVINSLRGMRGSAALSDRSVFLPDISKPLPESVFDIGRAIPGRDMVSLARNARVRFQSGLLAWYRGTDRKAALMSLREVLHDLQACAGSETAARFWWVGVALVDLLVAGDPEQVDDMKQLFGRIDRQIKRLLDSGEQAFADALTEELLLDMLFEIAGSSVTSGVPGEVAVHHGLSASRSMEEQAPVADGMYAVISEIAAAVAGAREDLNAYFANPGNHDSIRDLPKVLAGISDSLQLAGEERAASVATGIAGFVSDSLVDRQARLDEPRADALADAVCSVEFYLQELAENPAYGDAILGVAEESLATLRADDAAEPMAVDGAPENTLLEAAPVVTLPDDSPVISELQVIAEEPDEEILEIFIEEAAEELASLETSVSAWVADTDNSEALQTARRSLHTLKGSGRMLGALAVGEFAWMHENLLNRVIEGDVAASEQVTSQVLKAIPALQQLVDQVSGDVGAVEGDVNMLAGCALLLSRNQPVDGLVTGASTAPVTQQDSLLDIFRQEGGQHLEVLQAFVAAGDEPAEIPEPVYRALHTLPGIAEAAGVQPVAMLAGALNAYFEHHYHERLPVSVEAMNFLRHSVSEMVEMLARLPDCEADMAALEQFCEQVAAMPRTEINKADIVEAQEGEADEAAVAIEAAVAADVPAGNPFDDMDPELYECFLEEAGELVDASEATLRAWSQAPDDAEKVAEFQRQLHTLKGGARMLEITAMGDLCHAVESLVSRAAEGEMQPGGALFALLQEAHDCLAGMLENVRERVGPAAAGELARLLETFTGEAGIEKEGAPVEPVDDESVEPQTQAGGLFDDMDPELYECFLEEAGELVDASEVTLRAWSQAPDDAEKIAEFQRQLHTLKGGARMLEITAMGDLGHELESLVTRVTEGELHAGEMLFAMLHEAHDCLAGMLEKVRQQVEPEPAGELQARIRDWKNPAAGANKEALLENARHDEAETVTAGGEEEADAVEPAVVDDVEEDVETLAESGEIADADRAATAGEVRVEAQAPAVMPPRVERRKHRREGTEQVRVQSGLLDRMVNCAGEINIYRARMEQQVSDYRFHLGEMGKTIERLREQLRQLEMETEAHILYRYEQEDDRSEEFDPLEMDRYSTLQQLSRSLVESISDLVSIQEMMGTTTRDSETLLLQQSRVSTDLHEGLVHSRMVPFAGLAPRLRRIVRQSAKQLKKHVELGFDGVEGEMDRGVIDRIVAPLEHLLRNAVAHGIEMPDERTSNGKPATGRIDMDFSREGSEIVLRISDDGAGMNIDAIRSRAIEQGLMKKGDELADADIMQFVLQTGFSTAGEVSQIAGRGVGMDVVNSEVRQLGGSLEIGSEPGLGTTFTLRLPYTLALGNALLVRAGNQSFCVPLASVEGVVRADREDMLAVYQGETPTLEYAGNSYRVKHLGSLLGTGGVDMQRMPSQVSVILVRSGERRVALHVDEVAGSREIVVKPLGLQLGQVSSVSGATILGDGSVVMILDIPAVSRIKADTVMPVKTVSGDSGKLTAMVVDDSITVRKVTARLLERNGYNVVTASDGIDAMDKLQDTVPDIMLLDIEMPRMDGFELATHMRNDDHLKQLPVVMITSRTGNKHRDKARQIGITNYLGKPYQENELLDVIQSLVGADAQAASSTGER